MKFARLTSLQLAASGGLCGKANDSVVVTGTGLIQASTLGKGKVTSFTTNSDTQWTFIVPASAATGKIALTTPGGTATGTATLSITPQLLLDLNVSVGLVMGLVASTQHSR